MSKKIDKNLELFFLIFYHEFVKKNWTKILNFYYSIIFYFFKIWTKKFGKQTDKTYKNEKKNVRKINQTGLNRQKYKKTDKN